MAPIARHPRSSAPMRPLTLALALTMALSVAGCSRAADTGGFDKDKVITYLVNHPEILDEAIQKYNEKAAADADAEARHEAAVAKAALNKDPKVRQALEHDARDFVANPNGRITVTEFYDYRCPHCVNAAPKVLKIIQTNPDVRFVFKEMPIFGDTSEYAARAAIAVKNAGGDYLGMYQTMMSTRGLNEAAVDTIAKAHGIDPSAAQAGAAKASADAQISEVHKLAKTLAIGGTPTFVIGDTVVPGEDMESVQKAIDGAKATAKAG
jgi:protein-disulfide isomerase